MPRRVLNDFSFSADVRIVCADVNFAKSLWEDLKGFQGLLGQNVAHLWVKSVWKLRRTYHCVRIMALSGSSPSKSLFLSDRGWSDGFYRCQRCPDFGQIQRIFPSSARANPLGHLDDMTVEVPPVPAGHMLELDIAWFMAQRSRLAVIIDFAIATVHEQNISWSSVVLHCSVKFSFLWVAVRPCVSTRFASTKIKDTDLQWAAYSFTGWPHCNPGFSRVQGSGSPEFRQRTVSHQKGMPDGRSCCGDRVALLTFPNDLLVSIYFASAINLINPWGSNKIQSPCFETSWPSFFARRSVSIVL